MLCDSPLHAHWSFWNISACRCAHVWNEAKQSLTDPRWPWVAVLALRSMESGAFFLVPDAWGAEFRPEAQGDGSDRHRRTSVFRAPLRRSGSHSSCLNDAAGQRNSPDMEPWHCQAYVSWRHLSPHYYLPCCVPQFPFELSFCQSFFLRAVIPLYFTKNVDIG